MKEILSTVGIMLWGMLIGMSLAVLVCPPLAIVVGAWIHRLITN